MWQLELIIFFKNSAKVKLPKSSLSDDKEKISWFNQRQDGIHESVDTDININVCMCVNSVTVSPDLKIFQ